MNRRVGVAVVLGVIVSISSILNSRPDSKIPTLDGTLIYHRYSSYEAWDATLWMVDLPTGKHVQVDAQWKGMESPINAHFSPDGQSITFMGSNTSLAEKDWDVFVSHWKGKFWEEPRNLTGPNGARDEDPKFSPNGRTIIYKENGVLKIIDSISKVKKEVIGAPLESSMPYFSHDGQQILFEHGGEIFTLRNGIATSMRSGAGLSSYYPIALNQDSFLYTRVQSNRHDAIYKGYFNREKSYRYFFNSKDWDTSDPFPLGTGKHFIFYVSGDFSVPHGGYNLMVADLQRKKTMSIDDFFKGLRASDINSEQEELGPTWTKVRFQPN